MEKTLNSILVRLRKALSDTYSSLLNNTLDVKAAKIKIMAVKIKIMTAERIIDATITQIESDVSMKKIKQDRAKFIKPKK